MKDKDIDLRSSTLELSESKEVEAIALENTILPVETISFYENSLVLELAQTSLLIVIFITVLFSGIYKIGR